MHLYNGCTNICPDFVQHLSMPCPQFVSVGMKWAMAGLCIGYGWAGPGLGHDWVMGGLWVGRGWAMGNGQMAHFLGLSKAAHKLDMYHIFV